mgnify:CR=1 FL=1
MDIYKHYTPLGLFLLAVEGNRFIKSWFAAPDEEQAHHQHTPSLPNPFAADLDRYFRGEPISFDWPLKFSGTAFQQRVWHELVKIPYGQTLTYKQIGDQLGTKGYRAVGRAVGANPLVIVVPCHRVLAVNGLGGYSCGLPIKRSLLTLEKVLTENGAGQTAGLI